MKILSLDLELNKEGLETTDICQIGAVVGDLQTGEIFEELRVYIKTSKPLDPFIVKLTGIKQEDLDTKGVTLAEGYELLKAMAKRHDVYYSVLTWGGGDIECLRTQLGIDRSNWIFGRRWLDVKTVYQLRQMALGLKPQAGLAKAMVRSGLRFSGAKHDARDDAKNTFILAHHILGSNLSNKETFIPKEEG
jgi:inhibitor of KinA sporulation pathway (predicted exonuclease)